MAMKVRYTVIDGEVVGETRGGVERHYIPDGIGNVIAMTDETGAITDRFSYWPYGELASHTGTSETAFKFCGAHQYYTPPDSSLQYVTRRYYNPKTGVWGSVDPSGTSVGSNSYRYVSNRPTVAVDPMGLMTIIFDGTKVKVYNDSGVLIAMYPAYSGNAGVSTDTFNRHKIDPIPPHTYYVIPQWIEHAEPGVVERFGRGGFYPDPRGWGQFRVELFPEDGVYPYNRKGCYFHGGLDVGSAGCIDVGPNIAPLIDLISRQKGTSFINGLDLFPFVTPKERVNVIVTYPNRVVVPSDQDGGRIPWQTLTGKPPPPDIRRMQPGPTLAY